MQIIDIIIKYTNHRKQNDLEQFNNSSNCMYSGLQGKGDMSHNF